MNDFIQIVNDSHDRREALRMVAENQEQKRIRRKKVLARKLTEASLAAAASLSVSLVSVIWRSMGAISEGIAFPMFCAGLIFCGMNIGKIVKVLEKMGR